MVQQHERRETSYARRILELCGQTNIRSFHDSVHNLEYATDIVTDTDRVAVRVRPPRYLAFVNEFTIRVKASKADPTTEYQKFFQPDFPKNLWPTLFLYCFADFQGKPQPWVLMDMNCLRAHERWGILDSALLRKNVPVEGNPDNLMNVYSIPYLVRRCHDNPTDWTQRLFPYYSNGHPSFLQERRT